MRFEKDLETLDRVKDWELFMSIAEEMAERYYTETDNYDVSMMIDRFLHGEYTIKCFEIDTKLCEALESWYEARHKDFSKCINLQLWSGGVCFFVEETDNQNLDKNLFGGTGDGKAEKLFDKAIDLYTKDNSISLKDCFNLVLSKEQSQTQNATDRAKAVSMAAESGNKDMNKEKIEAR